MSKNYRNLKKIFFVISIVLCSLIILSSCSDKSDKESATNSPKVTEVATTEPTPTQTSTPTPTAKPQKEQNDFEIPEVITLEKIADLEKQNSDFVFWFCIPSDEIKPISYPVVQAKDNDFYLEKGFDKKYSKAGTLFLDYRSKADTMDGHNIIYGHNMGDGSMFGNTLKYYQSKDGSFLEKHPYIYTYSSKGVDVWKIFTVFETTTDEYYIKTKFASDFEYYNFIKNFKEKSYFDVDVELKAEDDILTLSTCYKFNASNGRLVISAVKVDSVPYAEVK